MARDTATPDHEMFRAKPNTEFHHEGTKDAKKGKKNWFCLPFVLFVPSW
jgi:hypothetical protein